VLKEALINSFSVILAHAGTQWFQCAGIPACADMTTLIRASLKRLLRCALDELNPEPVRAVGAGLPANRVLAAPELFAGKPAPTGRTVPPGFVTAKPGEMLAMTGMDRSDGCFRLERTLFYSDDP
jgi:hypothetical protein